VASIREKMLTGKGRNGKPLVRYQVMYRDPEGTQKSRNFERKADAKAFAASVEVDKSRGAYTDPAAGRTTFRAYAEGFLSRQTSNVSTQEATALRLRLHVLPAIGGKRLNSITPANVQALIKSLSASLAPTYVRVILANMSAVFTAAVDDGCIVKNPCAASSVSAPRVAAQRLEPWRQEQVVAVHAALPEPYRIIVTLAAGLGLRQGEVFGLSPEDVNFLRGVVHVRCQVKIVGNRLVYAAPKGGKVRDVPLPESVALDLAAHLASHPARAVVLPSDEPQGREQSRTLVLSSREDGALNRNYINAKLWKPALVEAGIDPTRANGMHALRHWYASVLLESGVTVKALSTYLGHSDPGFTLRTYTHLMPDSEANTRRAVDSALAGRPTAPHVDSSLTLAVSRGPV
jgi:integrase